MMYVIIMRYFVMECNVDIMLKKQADRLAQINSEKPIFTEYSVTQNDDYYKDTVSHTNVVGEVDGRLVITRYIDMKVRRVSFDKSVLFDKVMGYFNLSDAMFLLICDRKNLEL